jgi:hypothetical protein
MRLGELVAFASAILALQSAPPPETETPVIVERAIKLLVPDQLLAEINKWPRRFKPPVPCQLVRVELPNTQEGALDGVKTVLWADTEREIVWMEIVRGLDGRSEFRGPMRLSPDDRFLSVKRRSIPDCREEPAKNAA